MSAGVDLAPTSPFDGERLLAWLAARAVPGVETAEGTTYRRVVPTCGGPLVAVLDLGPDRARASFPTPPGRPAREDAIGRLTALVGASVAVAEAGRHLAADPRLAGAVRARPGLRPAGTVDGAELAVRAVLGQQVSVAAARTLAGRLVGACGRRVGGSDLSHAFPGPEDLVDADLAALGIPRSRAATVRALARALATGEVDLRPGADPAAARPALLAVRGVGPWTAEYIALRALADADAFPASDLGILRGARALGLPDSARDLAAHAERWRPWRGVAAEHLWAAAAQPGPRRVSRRDDAGARRCAANRRSRRRR